MQLFGQVIHESAETVHFRQGFSRREVEWGFCTLRGVSSKKIIDLALSR